MGHRQKQERAAIEAVARRFSATVEGHRDRAHAHLKVAGKRVAVEIATLNPRGTSRGRAAEPRLRFDKVVTRLMQRLQTSLGEAVPGGTTVLLTVTAPIRLPSRTAAALEARIPTLVGRGSSGRDEKDVIYGNRVRIRVLRNRSERAPALIGFVHNRESDPRLVLDMTRELLELIGGKAGRRAATRAGHRWLVVRSARGSSWLEAYRGIYSQLRPASGFEKVLMVFGDGRVELLTG